MSENERDFKGVWIPKEVWLDKRLSALDKVILTEIDSLDNGERGCWASNKHIAEFCQCSEWKVSTAISNLVNLGYLYVQSFDGRTRELKSRLSNFTKQTWENPKADSEKSQESNIKNNTDNNTSKKKERKSFDDLFTAYTSDEKTLELLGEWLKVRKAKRAAMTDKAIQLNLDKLDKLAKQSGMTVQKYLEEVIARGWAAFYEIKSFGKSDGKTYGANGIAITQTEEDDLAEIF